MRSNCLLWCGEAFQIAEPCWFLYCLNGVVCSRGSFVLERRIWGTSPSPNLFWPKPLRSLSIRHYPGWLICVQKLLCAPIAMTVLALDLLIILFWVCIVNCLITFWQQREQKLSKIKIVLTLGKVLGLSSDLGVISIFCVFCALNKYFTCLYVTFPILLNS